MQQQNGKMLLMQQCLDSQNRDEILLKVGFLRDNSYFIHAWILRIGILGYHESQLLCD